MYEQRRDVLHRTMTDTEPEGGSQCDLCGDELPDRGIYQTLCVNHEEFKIHTECFRRHIQINVVG